VQTNGQEIPSTVTISLLG